MTDENIVRRAHLRLVVLICVIAAATGLLLGSGAFRSYDVWWHLQLGQDILKSGHIGAYDEYSHTAHGSFRPPQQWLFEVAQALAYSAAGDAGLIWMRAVIAAVTFSLLAWLLLRRKCSYLTVLLAVFYIGNVGLPMIQCRPHIFLPLLLIGLLVILENSRERPWLLLAVVPFFAFWANIHASFTLGFAIIGMWTLHMSLGGSQHLEDGIHFSPKALAIGIGMGLLALIACVANPVGLRLLTYAVGFLPGGDCGWATSAVREWFAPDFTTLDSLSRLVMLLVGALVIVFRARKASLFQILLGICAVALGIRWLRGGFPAALLMIWAIAPLASRWADEAKMEVIGYRPGMANKPKREVLVAIVLITIVVLVNFGLSGLSPKQISNGHEAPAKGVAVDFPVAAVDWVIENRPEGKMFNLYEWGGYLIHRLYPDYSVFIDGRAEVYGEKVFGDFLTLHRAEAGWEKLLNKYDIGWAIVATGNKLIDAMEATPIWDVAYQDDIATVLVRRAAEPMKSPGSTPLTAYTTQP